MKWRQVVELAELVVESLSEVVDDEELLEQVGWQVLKQQVAPSERRGGSEPQEATA